MSKETIPDTEDEAFPDIDAQDAEIYIGIQGDEDEPAFELKHDPSDDEDEDFNVTASAEKKPERGNKGKFDGRQKLN